MKLLTALLICLTASATAQTETTVRKDVLLIDRVERTAVESTPRRGMLKSEVSATWGEPLSRSGPVGEPPISHWTYGPFTVYFEHDHVIHAVINKATDTESKPDLPR